MVPYTGSVRKFDIAKVRLVYRWAVRLNHFGLRYAALVKQQDWLNSTLKHDNGIPDVPVRVGEA